MDVNITFHIFIGAMAAFAIVQVFLILKSRKADKNKSPNNEKTDISTTPVPTPKIENKKDIEYSE